MRRHSSTLQADGSPVTWLGANFWSRNGGPLMWRSYDHAVIEEELRVLAEHGVTLTRSFFYWPDFHPEPETIDERLVEHYRDFLDAHHAAGMETIPTFIVGHMSGANWDPAWRGGRDLYTDVWMVERQAWFIREMTRRFHDHPAITGWLITNEMPLYGGGGSPAGQPVAGAHHEDVTAWASLMVQAVRAGGGTQPVSLGDGAWGIEITGRENGYRLRRLLQHIDFVGPHVYPMSNDQVRQHLTAAFNCELCQFGTPVVLEEFGLTDAFTSGDAAADYYRQVLYTSMLAGSTGWIAWNNTDFDLPDQDPYRHHPYELHFGITTTDGTPKPALLELARFRKTIDRIDVGHCRRAETQTAIVVSSYLEADHQGLINPNDRLMVRDVLLQAYISARLADLAPALVREVDGIEPAPLVIVPSAKALTTPTWTKLEEMAAAGSTVFVSYSVGETPSQRGPWNPVFDRFFGVRKLHRYGLADPVTDDVVRWTLTEPVGDLAVGAELAFRAAGTPDGRVFLPVEPTEARVLAVDGHGRPALLCREVGAGRIVLATYPVEYFAARTPRVNPDDTVALYDALARFAGVTPLVRTGDVRVFADVLEHEDGRRYAVLVSEADEHVKVSPVVAGGGVLADLDGQAVGATVDLAPFDVAVLEVRS